MPIILSSNERSRLRPLLIIVAFALWLPSAGRAETDIRDELTAYVGGDATALQQDFGEPMLKTPGQWWYSSKQRVSGGMPGAPNPGIIGGRLGVMVSGAGGDYEPLMVDQDSCEVTVTLDQAQSVTAIETDGPGCFEFLHALRRASSTDP